LEIVLAVIDESHPILAHFLLDGKDPKGFSGLFNRLPCGKPLGSVAKIKKQTGMTGHTCLLLYTLAGRENYKKKPRACRVSPGFEPASAGGSLLRNAALAQAYRVISIKLRTLIICIGSKREGDITYTAGLTVLYHNPQEGDR